MKQITAKTIEQALAWIATQPHYEVGCHYKRGQWRNGEQIADDAPTHVYYRNFHEKLVVPVTLEMFFKYIKPNTRAFDTRMFMLTPAGKDYLRRKNHARNVAEGMTVFESLIAEGVARPTDLVGQRFIGVVEGNKIVNTRPIL